MMLPGYFLAVTNTHISSFSRLEQSQLTVVNHALERAEHELTQKLTWQYFRFEHGSDQSENAALDAGESAVCGAGGCIVHAHTHLISANNDVGEYIYGLLPWQQLDRYEDLASFRGAPYIYLGRLGLHYAVAKPQLSGQWIRSQIANVKGPNVMKYDKIPLCGDGTINDVDWALHPGVANLIHTMILLGTIPTDETSQTGFMSLNKDNPAFYPSNNYVRPPGTKDWVSS